AVGAMLELAKGIKHGFPPGGARHFGRSQLEDDAGVARVAARAGRAIKVSLCVLDQTVRHLAVGAPALFAKGIKQCFAPRIAPHYGRRQLEDDTGVALVAAEAGCAVEVSGLVHDQAAVREFAVGAVPVASIAATKPVKDGFL